MERPAARRKFRRLRRAGPAVGVRVARAVVLVERGVHRGPVHDGREQDVAGGVQGVAVDRGGEEDFFAASGAAQRAGGDGGDRLSDRRGGVSGRGGAVLGGGGVGGGGV
eukprot:30968-Pelagococcus_subviridis.AAC.8